MCPDVVTRCTMGTILGTVQAVSSDPAPPARWPSRRYRASARERPRHSCRGGIGNPRPSGRGGCQFVHLEALSGRCTGRAAILLTSSIIRRGFVGVHSYKKLATDLGLWRKHVDPETALTEQEFSAIGVEQKMEAIRSVFGPEGCQPVMKMPSDWLQTNKALVERSSAMNW